MYLNILFFYIKYNLVLKCWNWDWLFELILHITVDYLNTNVCSDLAYKIKTDKIFYSLMKREIQIYNMFLPEVYFLLLLLNKKFETQLSILL